MIQALKINQGTKFGTLKTGPTFRLLRQFFEFNGMIKQNISGTTSSEQYLK